MNAPNTSVRWKSGIRAAMVAVMLWGFGLFAFAAALPGRAAAAADLGPLNFIVPYAIIFIIVGAVGLLLSYVAKDSIKPKNVPLVMAVSLILLIVGIVPYVVPGAAVTPPGAELFKFELIPSVGTTGGDTVPAGNYDSCDTEAGGTTGEWAAASGVYDAGSSAFTATISMDTNEDPADALWTEPNCLQMVFTVRLLNGRDANGDGATDAVNYFMRITTIGRTTLSTDGSNGTLNTAGFVRDGVSETNDWYLLYLTDASTWIAACPEARTASAVPSSCGFQGVGNHAGGAADTINAYVILEDRGLFGYQEPSDLSSVVMVYEFGGPGVQSQTFSLVIRLNTRATTNLT